MNFTGHGVSVSKRVYTGCLPQLRQLQRSIDQLCRENAALMESIEQVESEYVEPEPADDQEGE